MTAALTRARRLIKRGRLDNAGQIVVLEALRDGVLKYVKDSEFDMRFAPFCGNCGCIGFHGQRAGVLMLGDSWDLDADGNFWLSGDEFTHIFYAFIPSDPGHVAMLITDLIEYRKTLREGKR